MIVSEKEAKTKWCPFGRVVQNPSLPGAPVTLPVFNRIQDADGKLTDRPNGSNCIGSECMAWRWDFHPADGDEKAFGYCGLAQLA